MSEWINVKKQLPPFGEFVEVLFPDKSRLTFINRDFAAYWQDDTGCFWNREGSDERDWSKEGFGITHWRSMIPDPRGRKVYLKTDKNGCFVIYKKRVS